MAIIASNPPGATPDEGSNIPGKRLLDAALRDRPAENPTETAYCVAFEGAR
jgi:hypothetical protein